MENGPPMNTESEYESPEDTSEDSGKSQRSGPMPLGESRNSESPTPATTQRDSKKTLTNAELEALKLKVGLVAGVLSDFQAAKGLIARAEVIYTLPSGRECKALKLILLVPEYDLVAVQTEDGLDFEVR